MADVVDDFARANAGTLGANYSTHGADGSLAIVSNRAAGVGGQSRGNLRTAETFTADQEVEVLLASNLSSRVITLFIGIHDGGGDGYQASAYFTNSWNIVRLDNGAETQLAGGSVGADFGSAETLRFVRSGTGLSFYRGVTLLGSTTDGTYAAAGQPGLGTFGETLIETATFRGAIVGGASILPQMMQHSN